MSCKAINLGGGVAWVCGREVERLLCSVPLCGRGGAYLCDHPVTRKGTAGTCDKRLCETHRKTVGPDRDLCPAHAKAAGGAR